MLKNSCHNLKESRLMEAEWAGVAGLGGKGEGIKKYRSAVTKYSWGFKV